MHETVCCSLKPAGNLEDLDGCLKRRVSDGQTVRRSDGFAHVDGDVLCGTRRALELFVHGIRSRTVTLSARAARLSHSTRCTRCSASVQLVRLRLATPIRARSRVSRLTGTRPIRSLRRAAAPVRLTRLTQQVLHFDCRFRWILVFWICMFCMFCGIFAVDEGHRVEGCSVDVEGSGSVGGRHESTERGSVVGRAGSTVVRCCPSPPCSAHSSCSARLVCVLCVLCVQRGREPLAVNVMCLSVSIHRVRIGIGVHKHTEAKRVQ